MMHWLLLAIAVLFNVAGNLTMKHFATTTVISSPLSYIAPWFILGALLFGLNLVAYAKAIQNIPLVAAYPILVGSSTILLGGASVFVFSENVLPMMVAGIGFITAGILLVVWSLA